MSTISGTITHGITVGAGTYASPLTITTDGTVETSGMPAIFGSGSAATIFNSGLILGSGGLGIDLAVGTGGSTLTNAGTISGGGSSGTAVVFAGSNNLVIIDPGAVFTGIVNGGTGGDKLQLASAAGVGTLSGLSTKYIGFSIVTVDSGARWTLTGSNSLTGITLSDLGTLTNAGTLSGTGSLIVDSASLFNTGSIGVELAFSGSGYLDNEAGATIATTSIAVFGTAATPRIVNAGSIRSSAIYTVYLGDGGFLSNSQSGYIGSSGISFQVGGSTLINAGRIVDTFGNGVFIGSIFGTLTNSGTITGQTGGSRGTELYNGGTVNNTGTGLIQGYVGVAIDNTTGTGSWPNRKSHCHRHECRRGHRCRDPE